MWRSVPFKCGVIAHRTDKPAISSSVIGHRGPFCLLARCTAVNGHIQIFVRSDLLISLGQVPRGEIPGSCGEFMFNFLRALPNCFPNIGAISSSLPWRVGGPRTLRPHQHLLLCALKNVHTCSFFIVYIGVHVHLLQVMLREALHLQSLPSRGMPTATSPLNVLLSRAIVTLAGGYFP